MLTAECLVSIDPCLVSMEKEDCNICVVVFALYNNCQGPDSCMGKTVSFFWKMCALVQVSLIKGLQVLVHFFFVQILLIMVIGKIQLLPRSIITLIPVEAKIIFFVHE